MKIKLLVAAAATVVASSAMAQSAFQGFYGQIGIGYESTGVSYSGGTGDQNYSISQKNSNSFAGTVGIGGYYAVAPSFLLGLGAEYAPIPSTKGAITMTDGDGAVAATGTGQKLNSYNIFISPAIAIDKDKLAYVKVGYTGMTVEGVLDGSGDKKNYSGYSLGLGYKQMISNGLYGFGEVNYSAYSKQTDGSTLNGTNTPSATNVLIGLGYKF